MVKSLRLAWIARLISNSDDNWKAIPNFYFDKYGGLPFLLKCNYNTATLDNNLPLFYHELLDYFQELTKFSEYDKNNDLILWNNRRITIERNSVFWKQWFDQGVTFINDLMNSNGKFLTFEEFQNKFKLKLTISLFSINCCHSSRFEAKGIWFWSAWSNFRVLSNRR